MNIKPTERTKMKYVFWQNMISPHQSYFLRYIAKIRDVTLIIEEETNEKRNKQGWIKPDTGFAKILTFGNEDKFKVILADKSGVVHVFSGFKSYPKISKVFETIIDTHQICVIAESPVQLGIKQYLRMLLYHRYSSSFGTKIRHLFAIGELGVKFYRNVGFDPQRISRFQYFTEPPSYINNATIDTTEVNFCFIGQLIERKGIFTLLKALNKIKALNWKLHIVGSGFLDHVLKEYVQKNKLDLKVLFYGTLQNDAAMELLSSKADFLVLPSKFDGWGAVINESLSRGIKVITNEKCGASCLVKELNWGIIYKENSATSLLHTLHSVVTNFKQSTLAEKIEISQTFANKCLYEVIQKFLQIVEKSNNR